VTPRTLVVLASQSGRSAEIVALLDSFADRRPACLLGVTNEAESPLGRGADRLVPLLSGAEHTVSTRSYLNTLTATTLAIRTILGLNAPVAPFYRAVEALERYLGPEWDRHVAAIGDALGQPERLVILGRGPSLATAWQGALVLKEAAKVAAEGLGAAQFRHGPVEVADTRLTAVMLEGAAATADLNCRLARELHGWGAQVLWIGGQPPAGITRLPSPEAEGLAREVVDIVPLEVASVTLAQAKGIVPGAFRYGGKVTTVL
jgi:glucosamine--fructose-6-phosphate aminotransferase (isomerizing)